LGNPGCSQDKGLIGCGILGLKFLNAFEIPSIGHYCGKSIQLIKLRGHLLN